LSRASRAFVEAGWLAQEFGDFWTQIQSLWSRAVVSEIQGRLHEAECLYEEAYAIAAEHGVQPGSVAMADVGMSGLYYQRNKLEQAWRLLSGSVRNFSWPGTMHWWESPNMLVPGYLILARLLENSGDMKAAEASIDQAVQLCNDFDIFPDICSQVQASLVRLWLEHGELAKAVEWLERYQMNKNKTLEAWHECEDIASVRVLLALSRFAETQSQLAPLIESAEAGSRITHLIEMLVLRSLTLHATENYPGALDTLREALILSQSERYMRVFLDEGEPIRKLLKRLRTSKLSPQLKDYVNQLLEAPTSA
jgi:LuxR family maltose regulon positive regulatory protein